jgi:hypothetical protein
MEMRNRVGGLAAAADRKEANTVPRFAFRSLFLHEAFKKVDRRQERTVIFITGTEVEGVFVLDQTAEFEYEKHSWSGGSADT